MRGFVVQLVNMHLPFVVIYIVCGMTVIKFAGVQNMYILTLPLYIPLYKEWVSHIYCFAWRIYCYNLRIAELYYIHTQLSSGDQ